MMRLLKCISPRRRVLAFLCGISCFHLLLWCSPVQGQMIDGIVAVVDEKVIMHSDLLRKMNELGAQEYDPRAARQVLQIMVEDVIVDKLYRSLGLPRVDQMQAQEVSKAMNVDMVSAQSLIKRNSLMEMMVKSRVVITETMIKEYYDTHKEYSGSDSIHLKQILIKKDKEKAGAALRDLQKGVPFDEAAKTYSDVMAGDHADIGWISLQDMASEIRAGVKDAKAGDLVGPITVGENIFIFLVTEKGLSGGRPMNEVRDEIVSTLQDRHRKEAFEHWLTMIMAEHYIGIYL